MTTRNLRRMYFACSWFACGIPVLWTMAYLCGALVAKAAPRAPVWWLLAAELAAVAGCEHAFRALRRRGTHPWE